MEVDRVRLGLVARAASVQRGHAALHRRRHRAVVENDDSKKFRANVERFLFAGTVNGLLDFWNVFFFSYARARIIKRLREDVFRAI